MTLGQVGAPWRSLPRPPKPWNCQGVLLVMTEIQPDWSGLLKSRLCFESRGSLIGDCISKALSKLLLTLHLFPHYCCTPRSLIRSHTLNKVSLGHPRAGTGPRNSGVLADVAFLIWHTASALLTQLSTSSGLWAPVTAQLSHLSRRSIS